MYTDSEQRFLMREHATAGLREMVDLRELGCPDRIYNRRLEARASKLGPAFVRETARIPDAPAPSTPDLTAIF
jgi:hypothetical protein